MKFQYTQPLGHNEGSIKRYAHSTNYLLQTLERSSFTNFKANTLEQKIMPESSRQQEINSILKLIKNKTRKYKVSMKQTSYFEKNQQLLNPSSNYLKGGKRRYKLIKLESKRVQTRKSREP